jgi:hypothetical protein
MPPVVTSAEIEHPDAGASASATGPARFSQWQQGVQAADWTATPTPQGCRFPAGYCEPAVRVVLTTVCRLWCVAGCTRCRACPG